MNREKRKEMIDLRINGTVEYRWAGRFTAKDSSWSHMERQLVDYELIVMEKGTLYLQSEEIKYELKDGEYLLMEPSEFQKGYKSSKCRFYWMHFLLEEETGETHSEIPRSGQLKNPERLYVLMKQLQDSDLRYMDKGLNACLATAVLHELTNQIRGGECAEQEEDLKSRVDEYVLSHMSEKLTVADLAKHFGYHEKYFAALFKEKAGNSVKKYVDSRKVERAKYLLLNTDAWVAEISEHLGFENVRNFYHVFKKETNCTPSEYRSLYSKKYENNI